MGKSIQKIFYYLRLDDISHNMNLEKWLKIEKILDKTNVKPIVAIIPKNEDKGQKFNKKILNYKNIIKRWKSKGWIFAQHGYNHVYSQKKSGYFKYRSKKSEFAGYDYHTQYNKIEKGNFELNYLNIKTDIWVSPSGTFDLNTLKSLKDLKFKYIVDGISKWPYIKFNLIWIPLQSNTLIQKEKPGLWGFCLHPNTMSNKDFKILDLFLTKNNSRFEFDLFKLISKMIKKRSFFDKFWSYSRYLTFPLRKNKLYSLILYFMKK
tara:strand:+ start:4621 stop:5409 length:789 start_codon:yes stop_codon:yes gene_type:complete